ncbi:MAG: sensor histidine kinase [Granulosicoccus sp.]
MKSIRTVLTATLILPLGMVAALMAIETFYSARKVSAELNDRTLLAASLTILEHVISSNGSLLADATLDTLTETLGDLFFYHVRGPNGAFVTGYSQYPRLTKSDSFDSKLPVFYDGLHRGEPVRVVQMRRDLTDRELNGITTITVWQRTTQRHELTLSLFTRSLLRLLLLLLLAGIIVWFAVKVGLRPLARLQKSIDNRSDFALSPIRQFVPVELKGIVESMNTLLDRVAKSKSNRERFIGDAAHQLRNPIAAIKVQAEASLESDKPTVMRASLQQILEVSDKSAIMVDKLLSGVSAYALDDSHYREFDLSCLVRERASDLAPSAFDKGHEFSIVGTTESRFYTGHETLLGEAVSNLIHNAIQHNDPYTTISISMLVPENQNVIEIAVNDRGQAFSNDEFNELTQPFRTQGKDQSGSGLGLSIAKDIARMHNG